jgi:uncharacterized protein YggU (UPF0235/DUF167 family)
LTASIAVRVTPRSSRPGIGEWTSDPSGRPVLEVRVAAAPADGAANAELLAVLARQLGVSRSALAIVAGASARLKRVSTPCDDDDVRVRLGR